MWDHRPTADELLTARITRGWTPTATSMVDGEKVLGHAACRVAPLSAPGPVVGVMVDGVRVGTGARFSRFPLRTSPFEGCTFWTAAPIRPGDVVDLEDKSGLAIRVKVLMRPPAGEEQIRASAIVLGPATGAEWRETLTRLEQHPRLVELFEAEAAK